jgi:hypothetical protein
LVGYFYIFHIILWLFHFEACECKVAIVIFMGCGLDVISCCSRWNYGCKVHTCLVFRWQYWHGFPTMIHVYKRNKSFTLICAQLLSIKKNCWILTISCCIFHPSVQQQMWKKSTELWLVKSMSIHLLLQLNVFCKQLGMFTLVCEHLHSLVIPHNLPLWNSFV